MVSLFDKKFEIWAYMMFRSFAHFNPNIQMYYGAVPPSKELNHGMLQSTGAKFLPKRGGLEFKHKAVCDLALKEYVAGVLWKKLMWLDADTIVLRSLEHLFDIDGYDFIGHPGRGENGLITSAGHLTRYALGMYITNRRRFLDDLYHLGVSNPSLQGESMPCTKIINRSYQHLQLDGNEYNFGRDLIDTAEYDGKRISYCYAGKRYYPYTANYSRLSSGKRKESKAISQFWREVVCGVVDKDI